MRMLKSRLFVFLPLTLLADAASASGLRPSILDDFSARLDVRGAVYDADRSWLDDGFGKTRFGNGGEAGELTLGNVAVVWQPKIMELNLSGYAHFQAMPGQYNGIDVVEAFVKWRPVPDSQTRYGLRAGIFFPPISMEHDGIAWTPTRTITPSAINSWVGEEVLVLGLEGNISTELDGHELSITGAVFENNDTAGTLLTYRGWAMHDVLATAFGDFALPDRKAPWNAFYATQAPTTEAFREVDGRYGSYVRMDWSPPVPFTLNAMYYDNHGDPEVVKKGQYGWRTRFLNIGLGWDIDDKTELLAQYMNGETVMGHWMAPDGWMADLGYASAFALLSRQTDIGLFSGRLDWFEVRDRNYEFVDDNNEDGWAATLAWRRPLHDWATLAAEVLYINSKHPARVDQDIDPHQEEFVLQMALQLDLK